MEDVKKYVSTELNNSYNITSSEDDDYRMVLLMAEHGLYSGIAYARFGKTYRYVEFIINFPNRYFSIKGITGKELKKNSLNLNSVFNWGKMKAVDDSNYTASSFIRTAKKLGVLMNLYQEKVNIGRGIYRTINDFPVAELFAKTDALNIDINPENKVDDYYTNFIYELQLLYDKNKKTSIRKIIGFTKGEFKLFVEYFNKRKLNPWSGDIPGYYNDLVYTDYKNLKIKSNSQKEKKDMTKLEKFCIEYKRYAHAVIKVYPQCIKDYLLEVDEQRGYHDADKWYYNDCLREIEGALIREYLGLDSYDYIYADRVLLMLNIVSKGKVNYVGLRHLIQYAYGSAYHQQALGFNSFLNLYADYLNMVHDYDHYNKYPRYLATAHDIAKRNYEADSDFSPAIFNQYLKYKDPLECTFGDWAVVLLASSNEIINEGQQQSNCVASYVDYVKSRRDLILGLRNKDDQGKSLVTFELLIDPKDSTKLTMVQAYAPYDARLSAEQTEALERYCYTLGIKVKDQHSTLCGPKDDKISAISYFGKIDSQVHAKTLEAKKKMTRMRAVRRDC